MQYTSSILLAGAGLLATVSAHGFLAAPAPRIVGDAFKTTCGQQMYYNQFSDNGGNIQGELQVTRGQADFNAAACNVWLCKGYKFEDNAAANIQSFTPGQVVPFRFEIRAPHAGVANVSIVDTATNKIIGAPLVNYPDFANNARPTAADQLSFSVTIPSDLGSKCSVAGACVIQHYWDAASIDQTYESCVDFTVAGSGSAAPAPAPVSSSARPTATAAPTTLQTATRPTTTSVAVPTATSAKPIITSAPSPAPVPAPVEEDDCEEL